VADLTPSPRGRIANSWLPAGLLLHPFEVAVAALAVVISLALGVTAFDPHPETLTLVQRVMPFPLSLIWSLTLGFGGVLSLIGVFTRSTRRYSLPIETAGLLLSASAWLVYGIVVQASTERGAAVPIGTGYVLCAASLCRVYALVIAQRVARTTTRME
jgi:hypothetical protein